MAVKKTKNKLSKIKMLYLLSGAALVFIFALIFLQQEPRTITAVARESITCPTTPVGDSDIPTDSFIAYYSSDKKAYSGQQICEKVSVININNYDPGSVPTDNSNDLKAYWVGNLTFKKTETRHIAISQSHATTKVLVDGEQIVSSENESKTISHEFKKGTHKIEVYFDNDWHTANLSVKFEQPNKKSIADLKEKLADPEEGLDFVGVYESSAFGNVIKLNTKTSEQNHNLVVLSSYETVIWDLRNFSDGQIKSILVTSYQPGSGVVNNPKGSQVYFDTGPSNKETLYEADYFSQNKPLPSWLSEINPKLKINSFSGSYSPKEIDFPSKNL